MPWPRIRFTAAMLACVLLGFILGAAEAVISWRTERWVTR